MPREDRERRRERKHKRRHRDRRGGEGDATNGANGNTNSNNVSVNDHDRQRHPSQERDAAMAASGIDPDDFIDDTGPGGLYPGEESFKRPSLATAEMGTEGRESLLMDDYTDADTMHDRELSELQVLCDAASEADPSSWEKIRRWLRNHSADDARAAAERRGDYETTPLHLACRNCPPLDIVNMLLTASPRTVELADSFGWLPLHYACANEASEEVLVMLAEQYPESKTSVDKRRRTPLHFALGHTDRPANVATVVLLSGTGAALMADENGMLPLHYACAYGATEQALRVLTDENIQTITATDNRGRTPLHFALGNADRPASPGVVGLLLAQNPAVVNSIDLEGNLPVHLLATRAQAIKEDEKDKCSNCQQCFSLYLNAIPTATADLLTALQSLPEWLRDFAALSPVVQRILNVKISQRFPTAVTLADLFFYVIVIAFFHISVIQSVKDRTSEEAKDDMNMGLLAPLYLAVVYFCVREVVQAMSLASLGLFNTWVSDLENWLDVFYILLILFWTIVMTVEGIDDTQVFQTGAALSMCVFWVMILSFLKSIIVGFAVFFRGVIYVLKRLAAFLFTLAIILIAFTQIFHTLYKQSEECKDGDNAAAYTENPQTSIQCIPESNCTLEVDACENCTVKVDACEPINESPFCDFRTSFFKVFTMLLGEVDESFFRENKLATILFCVFMFACVVVLANVLIAIVTDSYSVIQNERSALVFWSNRLDFVAEMDAISNNFSRKGRGDAGLDEKDNFARELWKKFMYLFDDDIDEHGVMSFEFIVYNILRVFAACVVIPLWIIIGFFSLGMLWPPQVRERLLTSQTTRLQEKDSAERTRLNQMSKLREDVSSLQEEIRRDMDKGRDELYIIKAVLDSTKTEIHTEMDNVKEIVTELFEMLSER